MSIVRLGATLAGANRVTRRFSVIRDTFSGKPLAVVGVGAEYGAYVEFGTSRMQAQPYLFPAVRYVMSAKFAKLEAEARSQDDPIGWLIEALAFEIEAEAKKRAPVDTGFLRASITARRIR